MAESVRSLRNPWRPGDPGAIEALRDADFVRARLIADSSNYVFLVDLRHPDHGDGLGVYKPRRGERPLADFPYGTLPSREAAAWEYARLLGWELVPPTVEREGPEGDGSVQLFVDHDPAEHFFLLRDRAGLREPLMRVAAFDLLANNADRKAGHVLLGGDGRVWCIDNALCFHAEEKLRTVIWDFAGERLPAPWLDAVRRARDCLREGDAAADALRSCLGPGEAEALVARSTRLLEHPVLPEMRPWRCVPWPLI